MPNHVKISIKIKKPYNYILILFQYILKNKYIIIKDQKYTLKLKTILWLYWISIIWLKIIKNNKDIGIFSRQFIIMLINIRNLFKILINVFN
jgi:hypothetical protein